MKVQIIDASSGNWYRKYINSVFIVEGTNTGYRLLDTPENEKIIRTGDEVGKVELLKRLKNVKGLRLGVNGEHAIEITTGNNKDFSNLLSQEW
jgi:hypothetical protein